MARPKKQRVDFFPHYCHHGKTMFIVESRFGNDGYTFWFKLLELLGDSDGHYFYCRNPANWEFLQAKTRVDEKTCEEILDLLSKLEAIDPELWAAGVIWSNNFINEISEVYRNRRMKIPEKPDLSKFPASSQQNAQNQPDEKGKNELSDVETPIEPGFYTGKPPPEGVSTSENSQSRVEESNNPPLPPLEGGNGVGEGFLEWKRDYPPERSKGWRAAEKVWKKLARQGRLKSLEEMLAILAAHKGTDEWQKEEGRYIPLPHKYLEQGYFEDNSLQTREPPTCCPDCHNTGFRKAKPGEKHIGGKRVCECKDPDWEPCEARGP